MSSTAVLAFDLVRYLRWFWNEGNTKKVELDGGWFNAMPMLVFLLGLVLTAVALDSVQRAVQQNRMTEFERKTDGLIDQVNAIVDAQHYLLLGIRSLYDGVGSVSRSEFHRYMDSIDLTKSFPGAYAVSWFQRVPHHLLADFQRSVREDQSLVAGGYPDFQVWPETTAEEHHVVNFYYPDKPDNRALGFDVSTRADRRSTLENARDTGEFLTSSPMNLLSEDTDSKGLLFLLPVYSMANTSTLQEKRQHYTGALAGVFKIDVLMSRTSQNQFTAVSIRDLNTTYSEGFHSSDEPAFGAANARGAAEAGDLAVGVSADAAGTGGDEELAPFYHFGDEISEDFITLYRTMNIGNRQWQFDVSMSPSALKQIQENSYDTMIIAMGLSCSVLAALLTWFLASACVKALRKAEHLTGELKNRNSELRRSNNDLSQFAYIASRDLQAPARDVDMSVTLLEDALTTRVDPQVRSYLNHLRDSASHLRKLVDDLLDFARVDREALQLVAVDLNTLGRNVERRLASALLEAGARIEAGDLPMLSCDQEQIERLLFNLCSNALNCRVEGRPLVIRIQATLAGSHWEIRVIDNGAGIDQRFHDKLFQPFQRLDGYEAASATGLGLGICKQIVECHDGQIRIESSTESGSTMLVTLPVCQQLQRAA